MFVGCVRGSDLIRSAFSSPSLPQNQPELLYNRLCSAFLISTGFFFSFSLLYSLFLLFCFRSTNSLHITSIYLILPDIYYCLPYFPPNLLFSFFYQVEQFFLPSILFYFIYIFHNLARHLYSIYHSMAWLSKYTMGSWDQVSEMRKWCFGPPPPIHSSPSSAHNGIGQIRPKIWRLHFSTKREIADMSTHFFLNSEDESDAVEDF